MNLILNPLVTRIQNGTVRSSVDLCASCRYCTRRRSAITGAVETRCDALQTQPVVRTQVAECNRFMELGKLNLYEMSEIAWIVEARGKQIGFLSPEELQRRQQGAPSGAPIGF